MRPSFRLRGMRAVQLTIAATMLAVPASAFALPGATSPDSHPPVGWLPVRVAPRHISFGRPVSVTGSVAHGEAGRQVMLQSAASARGAWRRVASTRIGRRGRFAFHEHLRHSGVLRAVEIGLRRSHPEPVAHANTGGAGLATSAAPAHAAAVSRVAAVSVAARMRVAEREHAVIAGEQVQVAGQLLPAQAGRTVALQGHSAHGWSTLAHARTGRRGGFAVRYRPVSATDRHLRVLFGGDRANARVTGEAGAMTVYQPVAASWYDDGGTTACGFHAGLGVANRTLPCGTKVQLRHAGHTVTATVDDRGPYVYGREYDLNQTTAAALGFAGVGTVYASVSS